MDIASLVYASMGLSILHYNGLLDPFAILLTRNNPIHLRYCSCTHREAQTAQLRRASLAANSLSHCMAHDPAAPTSYRVQPDETSGSEVLRVYGIE